MSYEDEDGMETAPENEGFPAFMAAGLFMVATALFIIFGGLVAQAAWNAGVVGSLHALGASCGAISWATGMGLVILGIAVKWVLRVH